VSREVPHYSYDVYRKVRVSPSGSGSRVSASSTYTRSNYTAGSPPTACLMYRHLLVYRIQQARTQQGSKNILSRTIHVSSMHPQELYNNLQMLDCAQIRGLTLSSSSAFRDRFGEKRIDRITFVAHNPAIYLQEKTADEPHARTAPCEPYVVSRDLRHARELRTPNIPFTIIFIIFSTSMKGSKKSKKTQCIRR
jgi:hypothetical protein